MDMVLRELLYGPLPRSMPGQHSVFAGFADLRTSVFCGWPIRGPRKKVNCYDGHSCMGFMAPGELDLSRMSCEATLSNGLAGGWWRQEEVAVFFYHRLRACRHCGTFSCWQNYPRLLMFCLLVLFHWSSMIWFIEYVATYAMVYEASYAMWQAPVVSHWQWRALAPFILLPLEAVFR